MRIYIAGPMRGVPQFNYPAFDEAKARGEALGHEIVSPADLDRDERLLQDADVTPEICRRIAGRDIAHLLQCDAIAMLPGWIKSIGARAELFVAQWARLKVIRAETFGLMDYVPPLTPILKSVTPSVEEIVRGLPRTADGEIVRVGLTVYCPKGHGSVILPTSHIGGSLYCRWGDCWNPPCPDISGDRGYGTHYAADQCSAKPPETS